MKKLDIRFLKMAIVILAMHLPSLAFTQFTVSYEGGTPADYIGFYEAMTAIRTEVSVTEATITVAAGEHIVTGSFVTFARPIKVTVQGAGAASTWLMATADANYPFASGARTLIAANDNTAVTSKDNGLEMIFKDISFRNWGAAPGLNTSSGIFNARRRHANIKASFINCNFRNLRARDGALIRMRESPGNESYFENCSFTNISAHYGGGFPNGVFDYAGGTHTIKNCTFYQNTKLLDNTANPTSIRGSLISVTNDATGNYANTSLLLENNIFIGNTTDLAPTDAVYPVISVESIETGVNTITMKDNIFIGNNRTGKDLDCDIYYVESANVIFPETNSGNIGNRVIKKVGTDFSTTTLTGIQISDTYTYTHSSINFTMEGVFPKIFVDVEGVNYAVYTGEGGPVSTNNKLSGSDLTAFPNPSNGLFEIVISENQVNSNYEIYDAIGKIIKTGRFDSTRSNIDLSDVSKGMYFLKLNSGAGNAYTRLMVR